ncbi:MAG: hypothetical protein ABI193_10535 [Minicystis sp.]
MSAPRGATGLAALLVSLAACAAPPRVDPPWRPLHPDAAPSTEDWQAARAALRTLRVATGSPRTLKLGLTLREPLSGRVLTARGAAAIKPPDALRMILLGPGGTTALDLWIHGDAYRFAIPAIGLRKRGDAATPAVERRGLPVDFLRFWLLRPAEGALLWAERERAPDAQRFLLRDGPALVDLRSFEHQRIEARRSTWSSDLPGEPPHLLDVETVRASALGCGEVHYHQASTGLDVTVQCEGEEKAPPNPQAFVDPDAAAEDP